MVLYAYNFSTWETEAGGLQILGQPGLQSIFQVSLGYAVRSCLQNEKGLNFSINIFSFFPYSLPFLPSFLPFCFPDRVSL